jgi:hypothetical protein
MSESPGRRAPWAILLVLLSACATFPRGGALSRTIQVGQDDAHFVLAFQEIDAQEAEKISVALPSVLARLHRWGSFDVPVTIHIHPSHESLEAAVSHEGYPWLRAWARFDTIDLQSPRTWSLTGASSAQVSELLTHELTHCLMYQRSSSAWTWPFKGTPLWFREGMASVTAEQGYRRSSPRTIRDWMKAHPDRDPVGKGDALYQSEPDIVYGSAHRAFEYLIERHGAAVVTSILAEMKRGAGFGEAFRRSTTVAVSSFEQQFLQFILAGGWRANANLAPLGAQAFFDSQQGGQRASALRGVAAHTPERPSPVPDL